MLALIRYGYGATRSRCGDARGQPQPNGVHPVESSNTAGRATHHAVRGGAAHYHAALRVRDGLFFAEVHAVMRLQGGTTRCAWKAWIPNTGNDDLNMEEKSSPAPLDFSRRLGRAPLAPLVEARRRYLHSSRASWHFFRHAVYVVVSVSVSRQFLLHDA